MPWETLDWLYHRHIQELVDMQKRQNEQSGMNNFI